MKRIEPPLWTELELVGGHWWIGGRSQLGSWWTSVAVSMSSSQRRRHLYVNISFLFESTPSKHTNISFYCPHPSYNPPCKKNIQDPWIEVFLERPPHPSEMHHTSHIFQSHTSGDNFHGSIYPEWIDLCLGSWDLRENHFKFLCFNMSWFLKPVLMIWLLSTMDFLWDKDIIVLNTIGSWNGLSRIPFVWHINTAAASFLPLSQKYWVQMILWPLNNGAGTGLDDKLISWLTFVTDPTLLDLCRLTKYLNS